MKAIYLLLVILNFIAFMAHPNIYSAVGGACVALCLYGEMKND